MNTKYKIEFNLGDGIVRYAQQPDRTAAGRFVCSSSAEAAVFPDAKAAHQFLARHGFMKRTRARYASTGFRGVLDMPAPFTGWTLLVVPETWVDRLAARAQQKIGELRAEGTVGMGFDNFSMLVAPRGGDGPSGTNARWTYVQELRRIVSQLPAPFAGFVY